MRYARQEDYRVEIMAYDYAFHAPDELPSGWITFVLNNEQAHEIHEISFARIPEGVTYSEYLSEYIGAGKYYWKSTRPVKLTGPVFRLV